jgi:transposase
MNELCPMPGCSIERITPDGPGFLHIAAHGTRPGGRYPDCGRASRAVHSRYRRRPADLPSLGRAVGVELRVRRFYCRNAACARRTFAERLPELLGPRARRTRRLAEAQGRVGVALGGEAGARLLGHLAMPASADTVLRLVRGLPPPEPEPPRVVGVDDWAVRKGRTYGTILVDLERRRTLDLLPDRTATTLAAWLRHRPTIGVVARDRSTEHGRGAATGAPEATQVADRWHLLANVRQMVERWLAGAHARLRRLPVVPPAGQPAARRARAYPRTRAEAAASADHRARRLAVYEEVRRRHLAGEALLAIGRCSAAAAGG